MGLSEKEKIKAKFYQMLQQITEIVEKFKRWFFFFFAFIKAIILKEILEIFE